MTKNIDLPPKLFYPYLWWGERIFWASTYLLITKSPISWLARKSRIIAKVILSECFIDFKAGRGIYKTVLFEIQKFYIKKLKSYTYENN